MQPLNKVLSCLNALVSTLHQNQHSYMQITAQIDLHAFLFQSDADRLRCFAEYYL